MERCDKAGNERFLSAVINMGIKLPDIKSCWKRIAMGYYKPVPCHLNLDLVLDKIGVQLQVFFVVTR